MELRWDLEKYSVKFPPACVPMSSSSSSSMPILPVFGAAESNTLPVPVSSFIMAVVCCFPRDNEIIKTGKQEVCEGCFGWKATARFRPSRPILAHLVYEEQRKKTGSGFGFDHPFCKQQQCIDIVSIKSSCRLVEQVWVCRLIFLFSLYLLLSFDYRRDGFPDSLSISVYWGQRRRGTEGDTPLQTNRTTRCMMGGGSCWLHRHGYS